MTLDGTNTWILHEPNGSAAVLVDPGPDDPEHFRAVDDALRALDLHVGMVVLTHRHLDHSAGAAAFAGRHGAGVRALDPAWRLGDEGLSGGDVLAVGGLELHVVGTPGHSSDSVSLWLPADDAVLTGDTVLGRGTTVVAHPDGDLAEYLASLHRLRDLAAEHGLRRVLPGHGPALPDPVTLLDDYLAHRAARLDQVRAAVAAGAQSAADVVSVVYADVPRAAWPAATQSVQAQLDYLRATES
ncbi:MAG: MBL fold metallo-hydrolase [Actinomycetota bacterium]|nr:MAG: MBL fold metallo-hydrolase [Actinomycetota bacterium]